jgi:uncharacterized hydrophobic protein (TIGR00341 family)
MSARLVDIIVSDAEVDEARALIARHCRRFWQEAVPGGRDKFSCIVQSRYVERLLDELDTHFADSEGFWTTVETLEAVLPPLEETQETALPLEELPPPTRLEAFFSRDRISTDEIFDDIEQSTAIRPTYLLTVILSAIIAALGMRSGQTAVVIGAMVIAPLLGPTMGMALAATVGNRHLGSRSLATLVIGAVAALVATFVLGQLIEVDPSVPELFNRSIVHPGDVALALACGAAGVLAFSRGTSLSLVGVMIAVALVPPLAAAGLFFSKGYDGLAFNALFLFATNLVCVNLAGIAMFLVQGLPPKNWRMTGGIMAIWAFVLFLFVGSMVGRIAFGFGSFEWVEAILDRLGDTLS